MKVDGRAIRKVYLAGPMRGYPRYNFDAFAAAAASLRKRGLTVFSPAERDIREDGFNPDKDEARPMREYMEHDLPAVCRSDAVVVLDGWEKSKGACLEVHVARRVGVPVVSPELKPVGDRLSVLVEADALINGDRQAQYGPPTQDFQRTADMWTGLLQYRLLLNERIRPKDVAWMMIMLKASRAQHSDKRDNYVDAAGYAGCGWICAATPNTEAV